MGSLSQKSGQAMTGYLLLTVLVAIVLIPTIMQFQSTVEDVFDTGKEVVEERSQEALQRASQYLPPTQTHSSTNLAARMPKWKDSYVPMNTIWDLTFDPQNSGQMENQYEPAK